MRRGPGVGLKAVADDGAAGTRFLDRRVGPLAALGGLEFDQAVITSFDRLAPLAERLRALGIPEEKIFAIRG